MKTVSILGSVVGVLLCFVSSTSAFIAPRRSSTIHRKHPSVAPRDFDTQLNALPALEGIAPAIQSYVDIWTPMFLAAKEAGLAPEFLLKWGHGAAMSTVLLSMGLIGSWMGWQIRQGNGEQVNALTMGDTIRQQHPKIMGGAFFFFLLGGQGGLILLDTQGGNILESPHAVTAITGMSLLAVQALLPVLAFEKGGTTARSAHAYLGTATIVALFAHMATGLNLGLSL